MWFVLFKCRLGIIYHYHYWYLGICSCDCTFTGGCCVISQSLGTSEYQLCHINIICQYSRCSSFGYCSFNFTYSKTVSNQSLIRKLKTTYKIHRFRLLFGLVLIFVFIISKKPKTVSNKLDSFFTSSPEKQMSAFGNVENPVFNGTSEFHRTSSSSSPIYTATVKSEFN